MKNEATIGSIVTANFNTSLVFAELGIDFCCGGNVTLQVACENKNLNISEVILLLEEVSNLPMETRWEQLSARSLIHQITQIHHKYITTTAPAILLFLEKLVSRHSENHPELLKVDQLFHEAFTALLAHMKQEEMILFPYVEAMEEALTNGFDLAAPHFGHVRRPISDLEDEHEMEGNRFKLIAALTNNYQVPADGCETYQLTYRMLQEFEKDLHRHVHLENNILFPKARQLFTEISNINEIQK